MNLKDGVAFAQCEVAHGFWHEDEASRVHRRQLGLIKGFSGTDHERSLENGHVFVGRMPMRRNLSAIGTANPEHKRFALGAGIAGNVRVFAAHETGASISGRRRATVGVLIEWIGPLLPARMASRNNSSGFAWWSSSFSLGEFSQTARGVYSRPES